MNRLLKWGVTSAVALSIGFGALAGQLAVQAHDEEPQAFTIQAGASGPGNIDILAFAPQSLQVHKGDTVTWMNFGFHNVHFEDAPTEAFIAPEVNGQLMPQVNPLVAFPSIQSGSTYSGGNVGSGLPTTPESRFFSLVIDLEPGTYSYLCDIHPGMAGTITVVDAETAIPSPSEATIQGTAEMLGSYGAGAAVQSQQEAASIAPAEGSDAQIIMGSSNSGRATVNEYFPFNTTIKAGESVTWINPEGSIEPHIVAWPPVRGQDVIPVQVEGQEAPVLAMGPSLTPLTPDGASVGLNEPFGSGLMLPGQSYTLTFTDPGTYSFTCNIHPGMTGTIVVEPNA